MDEVYESVVEDTVDVENSTEEIDDNKTDDKLGNIDEDHDTVESSVENADVTLTDNQAGEVIEDVAEEMVTGDSAENKTVVDRIKTFLSGIFRIGSKTDDSPEEGIEIHAETGSVTERTSDIHTEVQEEKVVEAAVEK